LSFTTSQFPFQPHKVVCKLRLYAVCGGPSTISFKVPKFSPSSGQLDKSSSRDTLFTTNILKILEILLPTRQGKGPISAKTLPRLQVEGLPEPIFCNRGHLAQPPGLQI